MNEKNYMRCVLLVGTGVATLVVLTIISGYPALSLITVVGGMIVIYFCKTRVDVIIVDERAYKIGEQAARRTLQVFSIISGVTGALLVVLSQYGHPEVTQVGLTLAYSAIALLVLYSLFYRYYNKKYGI